MGVATDAPLRRKRLHALIGALVAALVFLAAYVTYGLELWPFNHLSNMRPATQQEIWTLEAAGMLPDTASDKVYIATGDVHLRTQQCMTVVLPPGTHWTGGALNRVSLVRYHKWEPDPHQFVRFYRPVCELYAAAAAQMDAGKLQPEQDNCDRIAASGSGTGRQVASQEASPDVLKHYLPNFDPKVDTPGYLVWAEDTKHGAELPIFLWLDGKPTHTLVLVPPISLVNFDLAYDRVRLYDSPAVVVNQFYLSGRHPEFPEAAPTSFASSGALQSLGLSCAVGG